MKANKNQSNHFSVGASCLMTNYWPACECDTANRTHRSCSCTYRGYVEHCVLFRSLQRGWQVCMKSTVSLECAYSTLLGAWHVHQECDLGGIVSGVLHWHCEPYCWFWYNPDPGMHIAHASVIHVPCYRAESHRYITHTGQSFMHHWFHVAP